MTNERSKSTHPSETNSGVKRPYVKPAFRHETVFEVMALACGKVSGVSGPCQANRKTS